MAPWLVLYASLINWFVTTIFVESHLFKAPRDWLVINGLFVQVRGVWHKLPFMWPEDATQEEVDIANADLRPMGWRGKVAQLVSCSMCTRTWVGFAEAVYFGGPLHGWAGIIANGLLYAAGGHLIMELRSTIAKP